jgi:hypothetical protein
MSLNSLSNVYATYNELSSYFNSPPSDTVPDTSTGPWRPPQWNNLPKDQQQLFMVKTSIATNSMAYFFDAIMKVEHSTEMKITEHPVQTGANISDHAYQMPSKLVMEIGMSDAMDTLGPNSWTGAYTKSISAYRTLIDLMQNRIPLSIHTRLINYGNMLIESIHAPDDYKTQFGGRFTVNFKQIITAQIFTTTTSDRPNVSTQTNSGTVNASAAPTGSFLSTATGGI